MNCLKSYSVFCVGIIIKLAMFLLYPLAVLFFGGLTHLIAILSGNFVSGLLSAASTIISAELLLDMFIYGGILCKDTNKLEYLKTSHKGIKVLESSLVVDRIRRWLMTCGLLGIIYLIGNQGISQLGLLSLVFAISGVTELMLLVSRHITSITWMMVVIMIASAIGVGIGYVALSLPPACVILFVLLFVGAVVVSKKVISSKMEAGYYDIKVEKVY